MPSIRARIASLAVRGLIRRDRLKREEAAAHFRKALERPLLPPVGLRGVSIGHRAREHVPCDELSVNDPERTLLYLHGGGFVAGTPRTYHNMCGRLARQTRARVWIPDYRLAPEHPFPTPLEDCLSVYRSLLEGGVDPRQLVVAGDSAGGSLTLALLLTLRDNGEPLPACAITLSPATDATLSGQSMRENARSDAMLSPTMVEHAASLYLQGADPALPAASPLWGEFEGLPPLMITVSESECLRDDALRVADKARKAGVPVELVSRRGLPHVWPVLVPVVPEASRDIERMARFIHTHA